MLRFITYLNEGKMNYVKMVPSQWDKPNAQTNEPRLDILRKIISDNISIPLNTGKEVTINNTKENQDAVNTLQSTMKPVKLSTSTGEISSSQIGSSNFTSV